MWVQTALDFIGMTRTDESLNVQIGELTADADLQALIDLARSEGFSSSERDLRDAFKHDWAMRWFTQTGSSE